MKHLHHHSLLVYPKSLHERFYVSIIAPIVIALAIGFLARLHGSEASGTDAVNFATILSATLATLLRILVAYVLSLLVSIPLALLAAYNRTLEIILLPLFDVFESIPNLAVFPLLLIIFLRIDFLDGAAIALLCMNMVWNIVFALVGGLKVIPRDITYAARVFGIRGLRYLTHVILPGVFPPLITGSILAVAQGWNMIIVAEALHSYLPRGVPSQDLFGIGTILVKASAEGQSESYLAAFITMIAVIALFNFFVWQRLLIFAQRFRFE